MKRLTLILSLIVLAMLVSSSPPAAGAPDRTAVRYYESPCQTAARVEFGVPLFNEALARWQREHLDTPEGLAYNQAVADCPRVAKFDWDNLVLVGTEWLD